VALKASIKVQGLNNKEESFNKGSYVLKADVQGKYVRKNMSNEQVRPNKNKMKTVN
jgi:hypothetical protein